MVVVVVVVVVAAALHPAQVPGTASLELTAQR